MILKVKIIPNASRNKIVGWHNDALKIKIKAPPRKSKANKELTSFLAKEWNIPKSSIEIIKGEKSRIKVLKFPEDFTIPQSDIPG